MAALPFENRGTYVLNIVLLFCVAIEPYLFYQLFQVPIGLLDFASAVYAIDGGAMMFILAGLAFLILGEERGHPDRAWGFNPGRFRQTMYAETASGVIFWVSALPFLWIPDSIGSYIRFDTWYAVFVVFFVILRLGRGVPNKSRLEEVESQPSQTTRTNASDPAGKM